MLKQIYIILNTYKNIKKHKCGGCVFLQSLISFSNSCDIQVDVSKIRYMLIMVKNKICRRLWS